MAIDLAIIGMSLDSPGGRNYQVFWENLEENKNLVTKIPKNRFNLKSFYGAEDHQTMAQYGGFIDNPYSFDASFFNMTPIEAEMTSPSQRKLITEVYRAIEDSGYKSIEFKKKRTGIYVGVTMNSQDYITEMNRTDVSFNAYRSVSGIGWLASKVASIYDFKGPSETIDTACTSVFVALDHASNAIKNKRCDQVIVAGVNLILSVDNFILYDRQMVLSHDSSQVNSFSEKADGYIRGEGIGVLILKEKSLAVRDGDYIYGVIKGIGYNNQGKGISFFSTSRKAQEDSMRQALKQARIKPEKIDFIEAHGSGISNGDYAEMAALKKVYNSKKRIDKLYLSSLKPNIGHLEGASGVAAIIKVLLAMKHKKIPSLAGFKSADPRFKLDKTCFSILKKSKNWEIRNKNNNNKRYAALNSYAIGGTTAHLIIENDETSIKRINREKKLSTKKKNIFVCTAKSMAQLKKYCEKMVLFFEKTTLDFNDICYTFQSGRDHFRFRIAFVANGAKEATSLLKEFLSGNEKSISIGETGSSIEQFLNDLLNDNPNYLNTLIDSDQLEKLSKLWVQGIEIDFENLKSNIKRNKIIGLPGYSFALENYKFGQNKSASGFESQNEFKTIQKEILLTENDKIIEHHKFYETSKLPAAYIIELVKSLFLYQNEHLEYISLNDVVFGRALDRIDNILKFNLDINKNLFEDLVFNINSNNENFCLGGINKYKYSKNIDYDFIDLLKNSNLIINSSKEIYKNYFFKINSNLGTIFQNIVKVYKNMNFIISEIDLNKYALKENKLHKDILKLDAGIQTINLIRPLLEIEQEQFNLMFPYSFKNIVWHNSIDSKFWVFTKINQNHFSDKLVFLDLYFVDKNGNLCISIEQLGYKSEFIDQDTQESLVFDKSTEFQIDKSTKDINIRNDLNIKTEKLLINILASVTGLLEKNIDVNTQLDSYGFDSILVMTLTQKLEKIFGVLSKTLFFEYLTIKSLADYFVLNHKSSLLDHFNIQLNESQNKKTKKDSKEKLNKINDFPKINNISNSTRLVNQNEEYTESNSEIAIIGISGKYPMSDNLDEFWQNLSKGKDCITKVPSDRWNIEKYKVKNSKNISFHNSQYGGFISDIDKFDSLFFNISPREAELMIPEERLVLEQSYQALEDSGYHKGNLNNQGNFDLSQIGVYIGVMFSEYPLLAADAQKFSKETSVFTGFASIANRVSYFFNFQGPSMSFDTMCSSSLTALHYACLDLKSKRTSMSIVGGVNLNIHPNKYLGLTREGFLSKQWSKSFGAGGEGYIPSDGVGVLVLKPLSKAEEDNDRIYGVIKGSAVNHGGRPNGFYVPNPNAQKNVIDLAIKDSNVNPRHISYLEAHGTGTSLGDPIELTGLTNAYKKYTSDIQFCAIGSVKSNIGHAEGAAGISGLTKIILQMQHKKLVPSIHSDEINPNLEFESTPFKLNRQLLDWKKPVVNGVELPRTAGLSSFGATGSNAHIIVEEYLKKSTKVNFNHSTNEPYLIVFSAKNKDRLNKLLENMLIFFKKGVKYDMNSISYMLQIGREMMTERLGILVYSFDEFFDFLNSYQKDNTNKHEKSVFYIEGNINQETNDLSSYQDKNPDELVKDLLINKDYKKLLHLWTSGLNINWNLLYENQKLLPEKISLPTYPFNKKRFWIDNNYDDDIDFKFSDKKIIETTNQNDFSDILIAKKDWVEVDLEIKNLMISDDEYEKFVFYDMAFQKLVDRLKETSNISCIQLISSENLSESIKNQAKQLFLFIKNIIKSKRKASIIIYGDYSNQFLKSHLYGLLSTAQLEYNYVKFKIVYLSFDVANNIEFYLKNLYKEFEHMDPKSIVKFNSSSRYELRLNSILPDNHKKNDSTRYESKKIFWITGGFGGLGLIFLKHLSYLKNVSFIVSGRSKIDSEKEKILIDLKNQFKIDVSYYSCDITDFDETNRFVNQISKEMGMIHGVIHSAGVLNDSLITNKSLDDFDKVLDPKVIGTINLDEVTKNHPLEFFMMFSSVSSEGNYGQVDYASANGFQSDFCEIRSRKVDRRDRNGSTVVLNWPLWKQGGMQVDERVKKTMENIFGVALLETNKALAIFDNLFDQNEHQNYFIWQGDIGKIKDFYNVDIINEKSSSYNSFLTTEEEVKEDHILKNIDVKNEIIDIVTKILKVNKDELIDDELFENYGFDSIKLGELAEELRVGLNVDMTPADFLEFNSVSKLASFLQEKKKYKNLDEITETNSQKPLEKLEVIQDNLNIKKQNKMAIVGIDYSFSHLNNDVDFWNVLINNKSIISKLDKVFWDTRGVDTEIDFEKYMGFGAMFEFDFLSQFDPDFFGLDKTIASYFDPQQRLLLMSIWRCIEKAGYNIDDLTKNNVGLFVAASNVDYHSLIQSHSKNLDPMSAYIGLNKSMMANHISKILNFKGPSMLIDVACPSTYVAISYAKDALFRGNCDSVVVAGAQILLDSKIYKASYDLDVLSKSGMMYSFDSRSDGFVRSEGIASMLIKRLDDAIRDKDQIYSVIDGIGISHIGRRSYSMLAPSSEAQIDAIDDAFKDLDYSFNDIKYVEAHGTATSFSDAAEINTFKQIKRNFEKKEMVVSSVKGNVGHLEPLSGFVSLIKGMLSIRNGIVPSIFSFKNLSSSIRLDNSSLRILGEKEHVFEESSFKNRKVGLNSFGFTGVNAHVVISGLDNLYKDRLNLKKPYLIAMSSNDKESLFILLHKYKEFLKNSRYSFISDISFTSLMGRKTFKRKIIFLIETITELQQLIDKVLTSNNFNIINRIFHNLDVEKPKLLNSIPKSFEFENNGNYRTVLEKYSRMWVNGENINWGGMFKDEEVNRIELPTYMFKKDVFWV